MSGQVKGAAAGHLRTLRDTTARPESRRSAAVQLRRMGFSELADATDIVGQEARQVTLLVLGRDAVWGQLEKTRFTVDRRVDVHQPNASSFANGSVIAGFLDSHGKPDERAQVFTTTPRVAQVQLGTGTGTNIATLGTTFCSLQPPFAAIPFENATEFTSRTVDVGGKSLTLVRQVQEVGRFGRHVLLTDDAKAPKPHAQLVQLVEHSYTAVEQDWANNYLGDVTAPMGGLAVTRLLEVGDPEVAVFVGGAVWMNQQIRPLD